VAESRLESVSIRDFRSIRGSVFVPLNAPVVLLHGANGAGKSSIMTALEMALTGRSTNLQRADPGYLRHLVHDDRGSCMIELRATIAGESLDSRIEIPATDSGAGILDEDLSRHFNERNYLPQSALGRLLEIYQRTELGTSSPLTRFVNELLGLDRYDALVEGLSQLHDVRNVRKLAPEYRDSERAEDSAAKRLKARSDELTQMRSQQDAARSALAQTLRSAGLDLPADADQAGWDRLQSDLASEYDDRALADARALRQEAHVLSARLDVLREFRELANLEEWVSRASSSVAQWQASEGVTLARAIEQVRSYFPDTPTIEATSPVDAHAAALTRALSEIDRCSSLLALDDQALQQSARVEQALVAARTRVARLDEQLSAVASAGEGESLAALLSDVLTHLDGQLCPVCDRDFDDVGDGPLEVHIAAKVARLTQSAQELTELSRARRAAANDVEAQERLRLAQARNILNVEDRARLRGRHSVLAEATSALTTLAEAAQRGHELLQDESSARQMASKERTQNQALRDLETAVDDLARRVLNNEGLRGPIGRDLEAIISELERRIEATSARSGARTSAAKALTELLDLQGKVQEAVNDLTELGRERSQAQAAIERATAVREAGRRVAREAQEARTEIVRTVFNDNLNSTWRDLFVRLAPSEPYVPAFRVPSSSAAAATAQLETVTRSGGRAGSPGTMLSAGNLNTAALTLFLSLHLTSPNPLPWLLLDDPVQSMDDVHTSQFAALLRTLSKQHHRQIVVAVHDRALFEYLTLELSPAYAGDELLTIEVARTEGQDTVVEPNYYRWEEDVAFPANLATTG
jgi:exonuclease SbcC